MIDEKLKQGCGFIWKPISIFSSKKNNKQAKKYYLLALLLFLTIAVASKQAPFPERLWKAQAQLRSAITE